MLRIQVGDDSSLFGENEIAPVAASEAHLWLKKQLDALDGGAR
jgi:hypothetical protein